MRVRSNGKVSFWVIVNILWAIGALVAYLLLWKYDRYFFRKMVEEAEAQGDDFISLGIAIWLVFHLYGLAGLGVVCFFQFITALVVNSRNANGDGSIRACLIWGGILKLLGGGVMAFLCWISYSFYARAGLIFACGVYLLCAIADFIFCGSRDFDIY